MIESENENRNVWWYSLSYPVQHAVMNVAIKLGSMNNGMVIPSNFVYPLCIYKPGTVVEQYYKLPDDTHSVALLALAFITLKEELGKFHI